MCRRHVVALVLSLAAYAAVARAARISGAIVEKGSRTPLAGAQVSLRSLPDSTLRARSITAADGRFALDSLRVGRYALTVRLLGYGALDLADGIAVASDAESRDLGLLELVAAPIRVKGVETSTARATALVTSDRNIYLAKDLPAAAAGTATDLLRAVPEVEVDINDNVSLRGSSSVTIQLNGRTSPLKGEALTTFLRQYPASRIERIEVVANPSAKYDPEGAGGIVNIVTKEPLDLGLSGSVYASLGNRGGGPSSRIAWQKGRLTLYGGLSGYRSTGDYRYDDQREYFTAQPPTSYSMSSASSYRNHFGSGDGSFDFALDKRSTLYGTLSGYVSPSVNSILAGYVLSNAASGVTSRYQRANDGDGRWRSGSGTLGFQHVVEKNRNEWSAEARASASPGDRSTGAVDHVFVPVDSTGRVTVLASEDHSRELSFQMDDTYPLGAKGKLESGYRGSARRTASTSELTVISGGAGGGLSDFVHDEQFHSGYLTAGTTFGRLSLQLGVRGEWAHTTFDVVPRATRYRNDYRSAFPSANVAWDFGQGRTLRATYSKRIERPSPYYLNPDVPSADTLNVTRGNPYLQPKYTHSVSLEATWQGSRGLLRLSPFYRQTIRNWDTFRKLDARGVLVNTWLNAAAIRFSGLSLVSSLRQVKRLGGTLNASIYRESHDASNLAPGARRVAVNWSLDGNAVWKATAKLDLQAWLQFNPARTLAQGRASAMLYSNLGGRYKINDRTWASLYVSDPFNIWKYSFVSSDPTYTQSTTNRGSMRRIGLAVGWSWGKPPETKARKQQDEAPREDPASQGH